RDGTLPAGARILSIECSRSFADSPLGAGSIVRVGDASSVFDHRLTNLVSSAAKESGIAHQRKLMDGGSCEATAFVAYGYPATGLCLPLANYHNMGNLDEVEAGGGPARPAPEAVSVDDYHGLVDLLLVAARAVDGDWDLSRRLDGLFDEAKGDLSAFRSARPCPDGSLRRVFGPRCSRGGTSRSGHWPRTTSGRCGNRSPPPATSCGRTCPMGRSSSWPTWSGPPPPGSGPRTRCSSPS